MARSVTELYTSEIRKAWKNQAIERWNLVFLQRELDI